MEHHVMQPAVAVGRLERRNARDGHRVETGVRRPDVMHDPQRSAALRDQSIAGRQQRNREGVVQTLGHDHDPDLVLLGRIEGVAALGQQNRCDANIRGLLCPRCERDEQRPGEKTQPGGRGT